MVYMTVQLESAIQLTSLFDVHILQLVVYNLG